MVYSVSDSMLEACAGQLARAERVVVFTGAGMSADSGVKTFRGSSSGFWSGCFGNMALLYFGTPFGWRLTPLLAFKSYLTSFYAPIMKASPHPGHFALVELENLLLSNHAQTFEVVTMNVDGYHQRAGNKTVHEVHGTITKHKCCKNGHPFKLDLNEVLDENYKLKNTVKLNTFKCPEPRCGSTPRPDCVLFTESLPSEEWRRAYTSCARLSENDVMLVIGTSNKVYPAAGLKDLANSRGVNVYNFDVAKDESIPDMILGKAIEILPELLEKVKAAVNMKTNK